MYISLEDSCTKDFSKWPGVYHLEIAKDVRADEADGDVAGDADLDNRVMTSPSRRIGHGSCPVRVGSKANRYLAHTQLLDNLWSPARAPARASGALAQ